MFYSDVLLAKQGLLANVWLAANLDKKLTRSQYLTTDIPQSVDIIVGEQQSSDSLTLRLSSQLLFGVAKIYHRQANYLFDDSKEVLTRIRASMKAQSNDGANTSSLLMNPNSRVNNHLNLSDPITNLDFVVPELPNEYLNSHMNNSTQGSNFDMLTETQSSTSMSSSRYRDSSIVGAGYNDSIEMDRADEFSGSIQSDADMSNAHDEPLDIDFSDGRANEEGNSLLDAIGTDLGGRIEDIEVERRALPYDGNDQDDFDFGGGLDYDYDGETDTRDKEQSQSFLVPDHENENDQQENHHENADLSNVSVHADDENAEPITTQIGENDRPRKTRKALPVDTRKELTYQQLQALQTNHNQVTKVRDNAALNIYEDTLTRFQMTPLSQVASLFYKSDIMRRVLGVELTPDLVKSNARDSETAQNTENAEDDLMGNSERGDAGMDSIMHNNRGYSYGRDDNQDEDQGFDMANYSDYEDAVDQGENEAEHIETHTQSGGYSEPIEVVDTTQISTRRVADMISRAIQSSSDSMSIAFTSLEAESKHEKVQNFFEVLVLASRDAIAVNQQVSFGEITIAGKPNLESITAL